jgi:hypothetical protein
LWGLGALVQAASDPKTCGALANTPETQASVDRVTGILLLEITTCNQNNPLGPASVCLVAVVR